MIPLNASCLNHSLFSQSKVVFCFHDHLTLSTEYFWYYVSSGQPWHWCRFGADSPCLASLPQERSWPPTPSTRLWPAATTWPTTTPSWWGWRRIVTTSSSRHLSRPRKVQSVVRKTVTSMAHGPCGESCSRPGPPLQRMEDSTLTQAGCLVKASLWLAAKKGKAEDAGHF